MVQLVLCVWRRARHLGAGVRRARHRVADRQHRPDKHPTAKVGSTKEMMQPCLIHLHAISLVALGRPAVRVLCCLMWTHCAFTSSKHVTAGESGCGRGGGRGVQIIAVTAGRGSSRRNRRMRPAAAPPDGFRGKLGCGLRRGGDCSAPQQCQGKSEDRSTRKP